MRLLNYARRVQSPAVSGIVGSAVHRLHTPIPSLPANEPSALVKRFLAPIVVVLLNLFVGATALGESGAQKISSAVSEGSAMGFAAADDISARFSILKSLADQAIGQDPAFLGRVRFSADSSDRTFSIDMDAVPSTLVLSKSDADAPVLEALIRLAVLNRDLQSAFPGEGSWRAETDAVERAARQCLQTPGSAEFPGDDAARPCVGQIDDSFSSLRKSVASFANAKGLKERDSRTRGIPGYPVHIAVVPPRAKLKVMTLLEYKKCQILQRPKDQYEWLDMVGSTFQMIGRYRYRVEWPADLNGPEEGDVEITGPQTLTFTPSR